MTNHIPERKRRCDSFFGLHFDFHSRGVLPVGDNLRPDVIARLLDETRPDYVQIDTKGHPGYSSYPTKAGNPAPDMRGDPVRMWRRLTAERGVALYGHHSGLFDKKAAADHPEWAAVEADGRISDSYLSVFGGYADSLLIPQLLELAVDYGLDGAWVDGECWAVRVDYSPAALEAWAKVSDEPAPKPGEAGYERYLAFCRDGFKAYVRHYIEAVKAKAPDFQLTSNWMYSAYMPEEPGDAPIDFISGDYSPSNSVNSARINGRFIANQGLPWDLMAWGHNSPGMWTTCNRSTKEYIQHCQEAAYILSLGGGFQFYNIQYDEGSTVQEWAIPVWAKTAAFIRAREPFCKGTRAVPQVGIFLPCESHTAELETLYNQGTRTMVSAKGLIHLVQDSGYSSELLETHNLTDRLLSEYGAVIVGHTAALDEDTRAKLLAYAGDGGHLLLASGDTAAQFGFSVEKAQDKLIHLYSGETLAPMESRVCDFTDGEAAGVYYDDNWMGSAPHTAAVTRTYGKGRITALAFDLGSAYPANRTTCVRDFFRRQLDFTPLIWVEGSDYAELSLMQRGDRLYIHLLNYAGPHELASVRGYRELPPLGPLTVHIGGRQPKAVWIEPEHCLWNGDARTVRVERLEVHTILAVEY